MKRQYLERSLLVIIGILISILFIGTIYGITKRKTETPQVLISQGKLKNLAAPKNSDIVEYYKLSTIRIISAPNSQIQDDTGSAMVVTPWLAYPQGDTVFYEEIARKQGTLKAIFSQYFAEKTQSEILSLGEDKITKDLLKLLNTQLSLGQISEIFFTDFLFL